MILERKLFAFGLLLLSFGVIFSPNARELRDVHPKLYVEGDSELTAWNVEKFLWKYSPQLEDGRRVWLDDIKAGKTLADWHKEKRPIEGKCWPMVIHPHLSARSLEIVFSDSPLSFSQIAEKLAEHASENATVLFAKPHNPVPSPLCDAPPLRKPHIASDIGETHTEFWEWWNAYMRTLPKDERRGLAANYDKWLKLRFIRESSKLAAGNVLPNSSFPKRTSDSDGGDRIDPVEIHYTLTADRVPIRRSTRGSGQRVPPKKEFIAAIEKRRWSRETKNALISFVYNFGEGNPKMWQYKWRIMTELRRQPFVDVLPIKYGAEKKPFDKSVV